MLLARIYATFPLRCSFGHAAMRIRSAPDLVMRNFFLGLGTLLSATHRVAGSWSGLDHFLPSGEPARGYTAFASDPKLKMCS
jgi:hypothetical protein